MNINDRIKDVRAVIGMNQSDFAKSINIQQATLSQIENSKIQPSLKILRKVHEIHGINYAYLIDGKRTNYVKSPDIGNYDNNIINPNYIKEKSRVIESLYQKIIDIRLMLGKIKNNDPESYLKGYMSDFSKVLWKYREDPFFRFDPKDTSSDFPLQKEDYFDRDSLGQEELNEYMHMLNDDIDFFSTSFFSNFREFYLLYRKDFYKKKRSSK